MSIISDNLVPQFRLISFDRDTQLHFATVQVFDDGSYREIAIHSPRKSSGLFIVSRADYDPEDDSCQFCNDDEYPTLGEAYSGALRDHLSVPA